MIEHMEMGRKGKIVHGFFSRPTGWNRVTCTQIPQKAESLISLSILSFCNICLTNMWDYPWLHTNFKIPPYNLWLQLFFTLHPFWLTLNISIGSPYSPPQPGIENRSSRQWLVQCISTIARTFKLLEIHLGYIDGMFLGNLLHKKCLSFHVSAS